jgi:hypothetical protein
MVPDCGEDQKNVRDEYVQAQLRVHAKGCPTAVSGIDVSIRGLYSEYGREKYEDVFKADSCW